MNDQNTFFIIQLFLRSNVAWKLSVVVIKRRDRARVRVRRNLSKDFYRFTRINVIIITFQSHTHTRNMSDELSRLGFDSKEINMIITRRLQCSWVSLDVRHNRYLESSRSVEEAYKKRSCLSSPSSSSATCRSQFYFVLLHSLFPQTHTCVRYV
jgi:hypothetical protein